MSIIILDRDGVINHDSDQYVKSVEEWLPIEGAIDAIAKLTQAGHKIFVATNQSGIGRGYYTVDVLTAMHDKMLSLIHQAGGEIKGIYFCPHHPDENCACRKPLAGMLDQLETEHNLSLSNSDAWFVGDSLRDLQSGLVKKCKPVLVKTGKGTATLAKGLPKELSSSLVFDDLLAFANYLTS